MFSPRFSYRRHADDFILDRTRPAWYVNHHVTDLYEAALRPVVALGGLGDLALLVEWAEERIDSSALGSHADNRLAIGMEHRFPTPSWTTLVWGVRLDDHSQYGTEVSPSVGLAYTLTPALKMTASVNRAFRAPSFTELYYADPANIGNPRLQAETAWAYEVGASFAPSEEIEVHTALFRRDARDLIDWVRADPTEPWRAVNIGEVRTEGIELRIVVRPHPTARLMLDYSFLDTDEPSASLLSKYVHHHPTHDLALRLRAPFLWDVRQQWVGRYTYRRGVDRHFLLGCRFLREIGPLALFVEGENLLNEAYEDIPGTPMPGRYVGGGVSLRW
jgi:iron complex outermembrane receptor protein